MSDQRLRLIWYPFCAITSSQMNLLANVVRSLPRLSTDPDLIARQRAVSPVRLAPPEPPLERCISVQDFRARFVCTKHSTARLNVTRSRKAVARARLITNCGLFKRLGSWKGLSSCALQPLHHFFLRLIGIKDTPLRVRNNNNK